MKPNFIHILNSKSFYELKILHIRKLKEYLNLRNKTNNYTQHFTFC